jgi:hypothetical protein
MTLHPEQATELQQRGPALLAPHDTNTAEEIQHLIQVQERCALATLHVLNPTAPA